MRGRPAGVQEQRAVKVGSGSGKQSPEVAAWT